jgi:hypothetical protein
MSPEEEIKRAERARHILNDDIFAEAVDQIRQALFRGIRDSAFKDDELREKLCQRYAILEDLLGQLEAVMQGGALAAEEIRRKSLLEQAVEKAKDFIGI